MGNVGMNGDFSALIAVVTVGIALAGLIVVSIRRLEASTNTRIDRLEASTNTHIDRLDAGLAELRERMAHLEGMLDGLREAIVGRARIGGTRAGSRE